MLIIFLEQERNSTLVDRATRPRPLRWLMTCAKEPNLTVILMLHTEESMASATTFTQARSSGAP